MLILDINHQYTELHFEFWCYQDSVSFECMLSLENYVVYCSHYPRSVDAQF